MEFSGKFSSRFSKIVDPGLLLVLLLTLFNLAPIVSSAGLPNGAETGSQLDRRAELVRSWELGLLTGSLLMCSGGMYLFCRRRYGRLGAVIGGLLYVYSPYLVLSLPIPGAAYPELLVHALFPVLMWRVDLMRDRPTAFNFVLVMLPQAALLSAHVALGFTMSAIAILWTLVETLIQQFNREASQMESNPSLLALLAMLLGLMAAAPVWLPAAMTERFSQALTEYQYDFASWEELLSIPAVDDVSAFTGRRAPKPLGIAQWTFALAGVATAALLYIRGYRSRHPQTFLGTGFFAVAALVLILLSLPEGRASWGSLSLPQALIFPPHLHAAIAACLAVVGSANGLWLERSPARFRLSNIALLTALPIATALPMLKVGQWSGVMLEAAAIAGAPGPLSESSTAGDLAAAASGIALALAIVVSLYLRGRPLTERPYWTAPPLTRQATIGILLGAMLAALILIITWQ